MMFFERWWLSEGRKLGRSNVSSIKQDGYEVRFDRPVSIWQALKVVSDKRKLN